MVRTHHICFRHPEVIQEVRRILGEQAATSSRDRTVTPAMGVVVPTS